MNEQIEKNIPLLENLLGEYRDVIGKNYEGYKNHCYRMLHFCFHLRRAAEPGFELSDEERQKLIIAAAFHDMGLWTENTVDYLPPSIALAREYLARENLSKWTEEIELMIDMHHKITAYKDKRFPLVEIFRQGDLVDFSLGLVKAKIPGSYIKEVKASFPNAGFHKTLLKVGTVWTFKHPLNPAPIFKW